MHSKKYKKRNLLEESINQLVGYLAGKPALTSAIAIICVYAGLDFPDHAPFLLIPLAISIKFFPRNVQWVILLSLIAGIAAHSIGSSPAKVLRNSIPEKGCGVVEAIQPRDKGAVIIIRNQHRLRLTEKRKLEALPLPGDSICYDARFYPVDPPTVPGAFDTQKWLNSQKFAAYGKLSHWSSWPGKWIPERSFFRFRQWVRHRLEKHLDPAETGLLLGLLVGDRSGIPETLRSDFQRSGLVHVLAISGFHVVLLAGMLMIFLKATGLKHRVVHILAILLLLLYIPVTGGSPAVRRAVLMFIVPQIGALLQRPANTFNSLGFALLLIILPEPNVIWNPGFQLSFAATVGILLGGLYNPLKMIPKSLQQNRIWSRFQSFVLDPTYVTLCATLATSPFLVHHFKTLSPMAWLGNIVVVPAISWGMQAGLFALISPIDFLSQQFCCAASFLLRLATWLTRNLSDSSMASVTIGPFGPIILLITGGLFLLFPIQRKNWIARKYSIFSLLLFAILFLAGAYRNVLFPSWSLTAIDIGQGDSILITTPSGKHFLVDSGDNSRQDSGKDIIVPYLHHIGVMKLDALIITHPDADHYGGSSSIIRMFPVKELWINECSRTEEKPEWKNFLAQVSGRNIPIRDINRGFVWRENFFEIEALHPQKNICKEANEGSITLRVKGLNHSAVLTGDLTTAGEKTILQTNFYLKSDVLKLGHHGSKTSSSRVFLEEVAPELALISSGRKNRFRHPHKQVIDRLDSLRIPYLNTATSGTISIKFTPTSMEVNKMLDR